MKHDGCGFLSLFRLLATRYPTMQFDRTKILSPHPVRGVILPQVGHGPKMNGGMVIKRNANQRYATNGVTGLVVRELARRAGLPRVQEFVVRNDCACGSTIGPIISSVTGIRAIDLGCPQLSMHSIRETMGVKDLTHGLALFRAFFGNFTQVDESIEG